MRMMRNIVWSRYKFFNDPVQVVDFEQLRRRTPPFNEGILESDNESRIRFAELRMCALTEKEQPTLLFSVVCFLFVVRLHFSRGLEFEYWCT